jgi:hypothetical protein
MLILTIFVLGGLVLMSIGPCWRIPRKVVFIHE